MWLRAYAMVDSFLESLPLLVVFRRYAPGLYILFLMNLQCKQIIVWIFRIFVSQNRCLYSEITVCGVREQNEVQKWRRLVCTWFEELVDACISLVPFFCVGFFHSLALIVFLFFLPAKTTSIVVEMRRFPIVKKKKISWRFFNASVKFYMKI